jgi:hypothetical protein
MTFVRYFDGNESEITVSSLADLPGPADLCYYDESCPKNIYIPAGIKNVKRLFQSGDAKTIIIDNNTLNWVTIDGHRVEEITIDCAIERLHLQAGISDQYFKLIFKDHAKVGTVVHGGSGEISEIRLTNGVGAGNAITFLRGMREHSKSRERRGEKVPRKKAELFFTGISEDAWRVILANVPDYCEVTCPGCPAAIKDVFPNLFFTSESADQSPKVECVTYHPRGCRQINP